MNPMTGIVMDSNLYILLYLFHPFSTFFSLFSMGDALKICIGIKLLLRIVMVSWYLHVSAYYLHDSACIYRYVSLWIFFCVSFTHTVHSAEAKELAKLKADNAT